MSTTTLQTRVSKLEASSSGPGDCPVCKGKVRIVGTDFRDGQPYSHGDERCSACGRMILVVKIQDVVDWRGQRNRRPEA